MKDKFQQIKHQVVDHPYYAFLGAVLVGGVGFAAYKYFFDGKNKKTTHAPAQQEKSFQQTYRQVILSVQQCINKHHALNGEVIKCILRNQYKLAECQFKAFIIKVRNQRRKMMDNKHEYRRLILLMDSASQQLMEKNLNAILAHFNIQKTHWIQTVELWSTDTEENKDEWENLLMDLDNQLLDTLRDKTKAPLSFKKLDEIYKFKIHSLNNLSQSGLDLQSSTTSDDEPDLNAKYTLIDKYIQDLVFKRFNIEEEDLFYSENRLSEIDKEKIYTIEDEYTEKIRTAIYGDEHSEVEQNVSGKKSRRSKSIEVEVEDKDEDWEDEDGEVEQGEAHKDEKQPEIKHEQNKAAEQKEKWGDAHHDEDEGQYF